MANNIKVIGDRISEKYEISKTFGAEIAGLVFDQINRMVIDGPVRIHGFGTFKMVDVKEKQARNPRTGEPVIVPACKKLKFKQFKP